MKHLPFDSIYRPDFQVVEQRQGKVRLYPHTDQLQTLFRAINFQFRVALPPRIGRVEPRSNGFDKIVLNHSALFFCNWVNAARSDDLRLYPLLDRNLVARPAIVQQITEDNRLGRFHRFRFYGGEDFFPEIYLCGKRVAFSEHALQRFSARAEFVAGEDLSTFLIVFFGSPMIAMPVGQGRAFIVSHLDSILAMTYKETEEEYFITSCLTINEIHSMEPELPPHAINSHYDLPFRRPLVRNWITVDHALEFYRCWDRKILPRKLEPNLNETKLSWYELAHLARDDKKNQGHGRGSKFFFMDNIPGPFALEARPNQFEGQYDEYAALKHLHPEYAWEYILAERELTGTLAPLEFPETPLDDPVEE